MSDFILPLFPAHGLAISVVTTVWVGVWVACFFNLRLGWVLSGLVVPGYLVPLLLVKPWAAGITILEAVVTYACVWFYSTYLAGKGHWTDFFGRDRFFALLVVSVLVRLFFDTVFFPAVGEYLNQLLSISFDYRNNLESYGLIVVALTANMFWKPGLRKGLVSVFVTVSITYLIVRYGLMAYTNFSVGNLAYMYDDLATSMLASPKAYIILLSTAALASRMNRYYGWEFSGILIPSLIALQWYRPWKLLITFGETLFILVLASLILRLTVFQRTTMEGARKMLLFFNISFVLKLIMGHLWLAYFPGYQVSDFYGFGYMLTTLLAIKMHDKEIPVIMVRASLQTSLVSVAGASIIGFCLTLLPTHLIFLQNRPVIESGTTAAAASELTSLKDLVRSEKVQVYQGRRHNGFVAPGLGELETLAQAFRFLSKYRKTGSADDLSQAKLLLQQVNYTVRIVEDRYLCLFEQGPRRGWGFFVLNLYERNPLLVEVPAPLNEWGVMEVGANIFNGTGAAALAVAGAGLRSTDNQSSNVLTNPRTPLSVFHREFGRSGVLQVRGYTKASRRLIRRSYRLAGEKTVKSSLPTTMWIKDDLPPGADLSWLRQYIGSFTIHWGASPLPNELRNIPGGGFVELALTREDCRKLLFKPLFFSQELTVMQKEQSIAGYLQDWLFSDNKRIAVKDSDLYVPPTLEEMLFFDEEVLKPLVHLTRKRAAGLSWSDKDLALLGDTSQAAGIMGYEIIRYRHTGTDSTYLILVEKDDVVPKRYWGFYIFRTTPARPYVVQIPRPLSDRNVFEYAVALFERLNAQFLLVGGAHPLANKDRSSDLLLMENKVNLFNLVSQVALREWGTAPMLLLQCRARGFQDDPVQEPVLIWFNTGITSPEKLDEHGQFLVTTLEHDLGSVSFVGERPQAAGYGSGGTISALYLNQTKNKEMATLWLSPSVRVLFRQQTENRLLERQIRALGLQTAHADLYTFLTAEETAASVSQLPESLVSDLESYIYNQNITALWRAVKAFPDYKFVQLLDISSKQAFLIVSPPGEGPALVVNLYPRDLKKTVQVPLSRLSRQVVTDFVESRVSWMKLGEAQ
ncbi:MAG TPA: hypothetical protein EYG88_01760 [Desulfocapsa sulfexigens]|nr:hypothetical protein [Desulfocapsa sulfexigens]